jgi:hypothetical protein
VRRSDDSNAVPSGRLRRHHALAPPSERRFDKRSGRLTVAPGIGARSRL